MQPNTAIQFAPVISEERKIDVAIDGSEAVIKLSNWVDGLGWCGQKTMRVDADMLEELHRVIAAARVRLHPAGIADDKGNAGRVLHFPASA